MKNFILVLLLSFNFVYAQVPQAFNYQAIARDGSGNPLVSKPIKVKLSILSETGGVQSVLYSETHSITTNAFGLFVLPAGKGTVVTGTFATIAWSDNTKKLLKSEIDPDGNGYSLVGTSDLQSVPFALSAKTVETENQKLTLTGNNLAISQGNSVDLTAFSSLWTKNQVGINYNQGHVGIGTSSPATLLEISGNFTGIERTQLALNNTSTDQDAVAGMGLGVGPTNQAGLQLFSDTYFPSTLPFWNGRMHVTTNSKNGILFNVTGNNTTANIEFANGPVSGQEIPVRMIVGYNGNVGIGTKTPTQKLDVSGKVRIQDLALDNTAAKVLVADATGVLGYKDVNSISGSQWDNNSVGINFSKGHVGIGTSSPITPLEIKGYYTGLDRTQIAISNTSTDQDAVAGIGVGVGPTYNGGFQVFSDTYFPSTLPFWSGRLLVSTNSKNGILLNATGGTSTTNIEFAVGPIVNQETPVRMLVGYNGNVGIGTKTPKSLLHVASGDVYLDDATKGIIMKSANGQCWKVSVGNTGTLTSATVICP